ncbi:MULTISPECIES: flagellar hook assembly protein FlgD [Pseudidiomarina]|uniref:Basal-body rod modification protein FlgD n=2 Tax=Pseudidiomarina TaxID=2800384 RepID=A0A368UWJ7_9GAMM|nr:MULTISPECIES: flagellar hook assembly protein FlgD [Pseudidiomarina]MDX1526794.1 flagellar hook assembly protein FlgD [Pseudidiomarina maritima]PWW13784.1 flagellar basal-body rod modification protein FlgD [Pseudidiomarina maritima]RBP91178.1 flagellar basal-body rod modification protein FlgD [Pseudidiomarina tainanensis]RCW33192.1 flagellar basal-body rod modification protein FlgD [Pseudidiomarina tainanensis]
MNTINNAVLNQVNQTTQNAQVASNSQEMRDNFMTLLVTQLRNQDPLNPMENNEMTSQLAQINTVSGIESLNDTMQNINGQMEAAKNMQASALIGRAVLVPGDRLLVGGEVGDVTPFGFELSAPAENVTVNIYNASGMLVKRMDVGAVGSGPQSFSWDGVMDDGNQAPAGSYNFTVEATNGDQAVTSQRFNYAQVIAVTMGQDGPRLDLGGILEPVRLEDVRQII